MILINKNFNFLKTFLISAFIGKKRCLLNLPKVAFKENLKPRIEFIKYITLLFTPKFLIIFKVLINSTDVKLKFIIRLDALIPKTTEDVSICKSC